MHTVVLTLLISKQLEIALIISYIVGCVNLGYAISNARRYVLCVGVYLHVFTVTSNGGVF